MVSSDGSSAGPCSSNFENMTDGQLRQMLNDVVSSLSGFRDLSHAARQDIANEALYQVFKSGRLDPSRQPVAYIKATAARLACKWAVQLKSETLVDDGQRLDAAATAAASREGCSTDPQECVVRDAPPDDRRLWGPTEEDELLGAVDDAIRDISAPQTRAVAEMQRQGMRAPDIAAEIGTTRNQVDQQWSRGRKAIRSAPAVSDRLRPAHIMPPRSRPEDSG
ncbi:RNA polymerase sigma factor [Streptomyces sp. NPDC005548]|uniref:RNA polymerase sigma factor n=1 Tax=Streptomyces sp. NPDC005548 TaxID=3364724 RepID=UPI003689558E